MNNINKEKSGVTMDKKPMVAPKEQWKKLGFSREQRRGG